MHSIHALTKALYRTLVVTLCLALVLPANPLPMYAAAKPQFQHGDLLGRAANFQLAKQNQESAALAPSQPLGLGWHLLSSPTAQPGSDPATVLASLAGSYNQVYAYDGCDASDPWKLYDPANPGASDLTAIDRTMGFWVEMTSAGAWEIDAGDESAVTIPLCAGWNLIGYPFQQGQSVARALNSIAGKVLRVFGNENPDILDPWSIFNQSSPNWANDLEVMEAGKGYWILVSEDVTLAMSAPSADTDLIPPTVTLTATPAIVNVGEPVVLSVTATDNEGVAVVALTVNDDAVALDGARQASFSPTSAGLYNAVATAVDAAGNSGRAEISFRARAGSDDGPPTVALTAPADGAFITKTVALMGTASDSDLAFYELQLARAPSGDYAVFARNTTAIVSGQLGELDPALHLPGLYAARVCAEDTWGNQACSDPLLYDLYSPRPKPGFARLAFLDGMIDLAGLPLTARRIYDSRIKSPGDFGVGWDLDLEQVTLQVTDVMGENWMVNVQSGLFDTYLLQPAAKHRVVVTLPDGSIHRFRLRVEPQQQQLYPIDLLDGAYFDPLPGTTTKLTTQDQPNLLDGATTGGAVEILDSDLNIYDPDDYTLIFPDGRRFTFTRPLGASEFRLAKVVDANGNTLTVTADGITHSAGGSMTFVRDNQGRIVEMQMNDGRTRSYAYDAAGDLVSATDFAGYTTQFRYDGEHNLLQIVDPRGHVPGTLVYDESGRITAMIDANGAQVDLDYDDAANQEIVSDRLGNTTINTYDDAGNLIATANPLGEETTYAYDDLGRVVARTDPLGHTESYAYDALGNLATYVDALGNTWRNEYDANGRLLRAIDPLNRVTQYAYDAKGNLTTVATPRGGQYVNSYNTNGELQSHTNPNGASVTFSYDANGRLSGYTDPLGRASQLSLRPDGQVASDQYTVDGQSVAYTYGYDANGSLTGLTLPDGRTSALHYDQGGFVTAAVNTGGVTQTTTYDDQGHLTQLLNYDGGANTFEYDAEGRVTALVAPTGQRAELTLDALGRPTLSKMADGATTMTTFDAAGRIASQEQQGSGVMAYTYDAVGRVTAETDSDGRTTAYGYDAAGQLRAITNTLGLRTEFDYDADGNLVETRFPDGATASSAYDLAGQRTHFVDERGGIVQYGYDPAGQLISTTNPLGEVTRFTYDELGGVERATTAGGQAWLFGHDTIGRETSRTFPWGGAEQYIYDSGGRITRIVDATNVATQFAYDAMGRITQRTLASGVIETQEYDRGSRLTRATDAAGQTTFAYDNKGHTQRINYPNGDFVEYSYNAAGKIQSVQTPGGATTYSYDQRGRLTNVNDTLTGNATYTYDAAGRLGVATLPDGSTTTISYHPRGWISRLRTVAADGSTVLRDQTYTYDAAGNPINISDAATGDLTGYGFDLAGRVISETRTGPDPANLNYAYDADWNLTQKGAQTLTYDGKLRLASDGVWSNYTYDEAGRPRSRSNGVVTENLTYDSLGRLTEVNRSGALPAQVKLTYNYRNLLVHIEADGQGRRLLWDALADTPQLLEERADDGTLIRRYTYGLGPIAVANGGQANTLHSDVLGSIRLVTDAGGAIHSRYGYTAYGDQTQGAADDASALRFAGQYYVPELGLYYMRARYYDATAGRFLTPDLMPTRPDLPQSYNPYLYVGANPVRFVDPQGTFSLISVGLVTTIASILVTLALTYLPSPVVLLAEAAGFDVHQLEMSMVGWSFALAYSKSIGVLGVQFDILSGPDKTMLVLSLFAGGQIGIAYGDPRFAASVTFWMGPILGRGDGNPSKPRPLTAYITFSGTFARMLTGLLAGKGRNDTVTPKWSRAASAVQWELGGTNYANTDVEGSFLASVALYGSHWGTVSPAKFIGKYKFIQDGIGNYVGKKYIARSVWDAGIAITVYFPVIWYVWGSGALSSYI